MQPLCKTYASFSKMNKRATIQPRDSTLGYIYPNKMKILIWKDTCTPMYIAALFITAKI